MYLWQNEIHVSVIFDKFAHFFGVLLLLLYFCGVLISKSYIKLSVF